MIITDFLEKNAKFYPKDCALVEINPTEERDNAHNWREANLIELSSADVPYKRQMDWQEFDIYANKTANFLLSRNIKKGTKIAILLMNCIEWLPIYFGILKAGCVVVPLNYRFSAEEINYCLDLADCEYLIYGKDFIDRIEEVKNKLTYIKTFFYVGKDVPEIAEDFINLRNYAKSNAVPIEISEDDIAAIYFSSGTTGFPKAILHKHKGLVASCEAEANHHSQKKDDCFLLIPPLYHTGAKMHWFGSLLTGSKAVLLRGVKPEWIFRAVSEEQCTIVWLLVPWVQDILEALDTGRIKINDYLLDQWRLLHIGAQPVPPSIVKRWLKYFPTHQYDTNYGLSESLGPGCVHLGVENVHKVGAIGKPGYNWEAKIVDNNFEEVKDGEIGELAVKGPSVMIEYYKNPEATNEVKRGDWLLTGDMAKKDEEGFIYLVDRKKDVIISGGENLYPVEIENFIRKNNKVKDVAVIGLPDVRLGEIATAIVEMVEGEEITDEEMFKFFEGLPRYKRPKKIMYEKIPRNPTGKIEKNVLRKKYCDIPVVEAVISN